MYSLREGAHEEMSHNPEAAEGWEMSMEGKRAEADGEAEREGVCVVYGDWERESVGVGEGNIV